MNRHNKHYSDEELALLLRAKEEVDEKMDSPAVKAMVSEVGGVWKYISKVYFDSKRKPKALAEQYRKEYNKLLDEASKQASEKEEAPAPTNDNVRQLPIPFNKEEKKETTLLEEVRETNRLLRRIISIMLDDDPPAGEGRLMIPHAPVQSSPSLRTAN